jgi:SAM-dependent methyltransferase
MKKYIFSLVLVKSALLLIFTFLVFSACDDFNDANAQVVSAPAATPTPPTPDANINRPTSEPYTGDLSIFEAAERAKNLQIDRVMDILKISEGKTIADIGAGSGWFTVRAAQRAGAGGKVYAVEISPDAIKYIDERAKRENFTNIQTVLGTEDDPKLPENAVDAVLILKTYHEIAQPVKVLLNLKKSLKKDALVGVIDRNGTGADHGIQMQTVIDEFARAGYEKVADYDFVKPDGMDYLLIFRAKN